MSRASSFILLMLGLACISARPAAAQAIRSRGCHKPKVPIGVLDASGTVRFQLNRDGKPASGSVAAVSANGASLAGLQSAADRQLSACRFDTRALKRSFPLTVEAKIRFDTLQAWFSDPVVTLDQRTPEPVTIPGSPGPGPFPATLPAVDERPREQGCQAAMMSQRFPAGHSIQDFMRTAELTQSYQYGAAVARFEVKEDGRVDERSIEVLRATTPLLREKVMKTVAKCRFAPGRIGGVPVRVLTTEILWIR